MGVFEGYYHTSMILKLTISRYMSALLERFAKRAGLSRTASAKLLLSQVEELIQRGKLNDLLGLNWAIAVDEQRASSEDAQKAAAENDAAALADRRAAQMAGKPLEELIDEVDNIEVQSVPCAKCKLLILADHEVMFGPQREMMHRRCPTHQVPLKPR